MLEPDGEGIRLALMLCLIAKEAMTHHGFRIFLL